MRTTGTALICIGVIMFLVAMVGLLLVRAKSSPDTGDAHAYLQHGQDCYQAGYFAGLAADMKGADPDAIKTMRAAEDKMRHYCGTEQ